MASFLLVHCGFAGGWTWSAVADLLRARGHRAYAPTLTGLGERAHLAHPGVDLTTHIQDLLAVAACEQIAAPIVVASSSGAMAATGFVQRLEPPARRIVYLDTLVPAVGQTWIELLGPAVAAPLLDAARRLGDGWRVPHPDARPPRWVPQPLASVTEPLAAGPVAAAAVPATFVHCTAKPAGWFFGLGTRIAEHAARAARAGWDVRELATDHLPMLSAPAALAELLHAIASAADA